MARPWVFFLWGGEVIYFQKSVLRLSTTGTFVSIGRKGLETQFFVVLLNSFSSGPNAATTKSLEIQGLASPTMPTKTIGYPFVIAS